MVLRSATALRGALEGVGPENRDFLGPEMARAKRVPFGPKCDTLRTSTSSQLSPIGT